MEVLLVLAVALLLLESAALLVIVRRDADALAASERDRGRLEERCRLHSVARAEFLERVDELEAELARQAAGPDLEGRYVLVNTPKPDDQSLRGWVRRVYAGGELELSDAELLERGPDGAIVAQPAGTVLVPARSWVGLDATPPAQG